MRSPASGGPGGGADGPQDRTGGARPARHRPLDGRGVPVVAADVQPPAEGHRPAQLERREGITGGAPTRYSGETPESEPEVGYLCNYLRFNREKIHAILTLHTQGEEIYYTSGGKTAPRSDSIAKALSRLCGYRLSVPEGLAAYGGLTDWCIRSLGIPSFTVECGKGENPLPLENYFCIYATLRQMLFEAPLLL